jgi:hypothetical protein
VRCLEEDWEKEEEEKRRKRKRAEGKDERSKEWF